MAQRLLCQVIARGAEALAAALAPRHRMVSNKSMIKTAKETTVKGFLIFSGALAMLVGLAAMLVGNLHFLGFLRPKKGRP
jgi:hypothetical protein